jgi:serine/threonine-protein kinase
VVDFGLVKQLGDGQTPESTPDANTLMTRTASNMDRRHPAIPFTEQAMGAEVDARSDLFAIGALLYECLAGRPAFSGGKRSGDWRADSSLQSATAVGY